MPLIVRRQVGEAADTARKKATAERTVGHQANAVVAEGRQNVAFDVNEQIEPA